MKAMETIEDLIEEGKVRTVWWALCIFMVTYILSHTSTSMWMNLPVAILSVAFLRILTNEVEFRWKVKSTGRRQTYLSHLEKKILSVNDPRLSSAPPPQKKKNNIDSPVVESAIKDFIDKILRDFVIDLWYSEISPDKEAPELIRSIIMDALDEIAIRIKEINLVDLLTRDIIDLVGDHLDLFRRNQAAIGADVMRTLSTEQRDERLKHHLMASKELHPALLSPESEYKVLQRLIGGILAVVLRPREAQCPIVRTIAREIVTCLVVQPILDFASPMFINEMIEFVFIALKEYASTLIKGDKSTKAVGHPRDQSVENCNAPAMKHSNSTNLRNNMALAKVDDKIALNSNASDDEPLQTRPADWARILEAATQRRTEVLTPENLENMWTKGRNYKKKEHKKLRGVQEPIAKGSDINTTSNLGKELVINNLATSNGAEDVAIVRLTPGLSPNARLDDTERQIVHDVKKELSNEGKYLVDDLVDDNTVSTEGKNQLKRSNSNSALRAQAGAEQVCTGDGGGPIISEFYGPDFAKPSEEYKAKSVMDTVIRSEGPHAPKLRCRVVGAFFEKLGSKSFAVYSIAVTDAENKTWFVKRRYRNFERLHRQLKDIPNYTLHLPPKRIFSSSTEDSFVHQRCIQLDKYLQDLLSIANVAEQHEVWDFLSVSSKNYSFGRSSSVMKTLAVNVDDAVDDIVRQFKGVSGGLMRKVSGSASSPREVSSLVLSKNLSWNASDEINMYMSRQNTAGSGNSLSDNEEGDKDESHYHEEVQDKEQTNGWHSDNELNSRDFPPRILKFEKLSRSLEPERTEEAKSRQFSQGGLPSSTSQVPSDYLEDPLGMPPEWTPPNVSVPLLNLVDKIFLLNRRGWLRRQVFWISKQILQLVMEDAIDDFLMRQIHWLRREDIIAKGIRWLQDILWPGGTFFLKLRNTQSSVDNTHSSQMPFQFTGQLGGVKVPKPRSFEQEFEATRRANAVKKILFDEVPSALVSLIGQKQYRRCARDMYYFLQSTICIKQLTYATLELLLVSVFPELRELVLDIHEKMPVPQP